MDQIALSGLTGLLLGHVVTKKVDAQEAKKQDEFYTAMIKSSLLFNKNCLKVFDYVRLHSYGSDISTIQNPWEAAYLTWEMGCQVFAIVNVVLTHKGLERIDSPKRLENYKREVDNHNQTLIVIEKHKDRNLDTEKILGEYYTYEQYTLLSTIFFSSRWKCTKIPEMQAEQTVQHSEYFLKLVLKFISQVMKVDSVNFDEKVFIMVAAMLVKPLLQIVQQILYSLKNSKNFGKHIEGFFIPGGLPSPEHVSMCNAWYSMYGPRGKR